MNRMSQAADDARYLIDRGYPKESAILFVSDHYCLSKEQRIVLTRSIIEFNLARLRTAKALPLNALHGRSVFVDGYNVLITVESLIEGYPVYMCDDGFLRDTRGIYGGYKCSKSTSRSLFEIMELLALADPSWVEVLLDQQISLSGELAEQIRSIISSQCLDGDARTDKDVDRLLKNANSIVATSDGNVIDAATSVIDLPFHLASRKNINILSL